MPVSRHAAQPLYYLDRGSGEPVLLIHGLGSSSADWAFQIPALEPRCRVLAPDLPGCGHSAAPVGGYEIAGMARALWALVDGLALPAINLVGFSLGGSVALEMALQRPAAVPRLALINSLATYRIDHWRKWLEARVPAALVRVIGMQGMARLVAKRSFPLPWQHEMRRRVVEVIGAVPAKTYLGMAGALERWSALERLARLPCRSLVIASEFDFTPVAEKQLLAERIGGSLVVVRGSRHGTPFDSIQVTNASLLALLTDAPLPEAERWVRDEGLDYPMAQVAVGIAAEHAADAAALAESREWHRGG
ncbi:MAG: alpha/beta hydrolase [Steroidobacteraceae bacterium]|jgi:pimeloyl-ACP methyl ester carboxylesterase|nr:alpha/beta hydrolase [Steroidobacteraceae bacterium]